MYETSGWDDDVVLTASLCIPLYKALNLSFFMLYIGTGCFFPKVVQQGGRPRWSSG